MVAEPVLLIASRRAIHAGWPSLSFQFNRCTTSTRVYGSARTGTTSSKLLMESSMECGFTIRLNRSVR